MAESIYLKFGGLNPFCILGTIFVNSVRHMWSRKG